MLITAERHSGKELIKALSLKSSGWLTVMLEIDHKQRPLMATTTPFPQDVHYATQPAKASSIRDSIYK